MTPKSYYGPATGSNAEEIEKAKRVISDAKTILKSLTSNVELTGSPDSGESELNAGLGLVARLRDGKRYAPNHWSVMVEAANTIERLQRDNAQLQYALEQSELWVSKIADNLDQYIDTERDFLAGA